MANNRTHVSMIEILVQIEGMSKYRKVGQRSKIEDPKMGNTHSEIWKNLAKDTFLII